MTFAGYSGIVLFELNFELTEPAQVSLNVNFSAHFGANARENAEAAELLNAMYGHERVILRNPELFPSAGGISEHLEHVYDDGMLAAMEWRKEFYAEVAFIEDVLGVQLPIPDRWEMEDADTAGTVAEMLRSGEGTATFEQAEGFVQNPSEIPRLPGEFRSQATTRRRVLYGNASKAALQQQCPREVRRPGRRAPSGSVRP